VARKRRRAIGAELVDEGVHFRVWAPAHQRVSVVIDGHASPLEREPGGYHSGLIRDARAGTRYKFRLADGDYPDPASRSQPDGPHGHSVVVDSKYEWRAESPRIDDHIISEIHIGTFTREGTYAAAIEKLALLKDAGINTIEVMPVNEFPGRFGWGYDGVDLWAPAHIYGSPDDFRTFIDSAHALGLAVILDVVYNHFGPDGCYVAKFAPQYFTKKYGNEWGEAINFEEESVCEFFAENAAYWIDEFHLDGLRLDATQAINVIDAVGVITKRARSVTDRDLYIYTENEPQDVRLIKELGVDAMWNDDWHHAANVALTGYREAYYSDYYGHARELASMARHGFLFQGQWYTWQKQQRGTPSHDIDPHRFICYLQNHDQIANSAFGLRIDRLTSPRGLRALTALLLLGAHTPLLFQGQEFASSSPFLYFADHPPDLAQAVAKGRREFLGQFPSITHFIPPHNERTFTDCKIDWNERDKNKDVVDFHRELIRLRATMPRTRPEVATLTQHALALRWFAVTPSVSEGSGRRGARSSRPPDPSLTLGVTDVLLVINWGDEPIPMSEALLAPPLHSEGRTSPSALPRESAASPRRADEGVRPSESARKWISVWSCDGAELFTSSNADASDRRDRDRSS
jgi:maltooligosyltrehalose trehalohydrolase